MFVVAGPTYAFRVPILISSHEPRADAQMLRRVTTKVRFGVYRLTAKALI